MESASGWANAMVDHNNNTNLNNNKDDDPNTPLIQDPYIYTGAGDASGTGTQFVSLAVNTNQYGRTFQDRSYKFAIKKRPTTVTCDNPNNNPACR